MNIPISEIERLEKRILALEKVAHAAVDLRPAVEEIVREMLQDKKTELKKPSFIPPTLEEVKAYAVELELPAGEPQAFIDWFTNTDWRVGRAKTKMKDWKGALRTWKKNWEERGGNRNQATLFNKPADRDRQIQSFGRELETLMQEIDKARGMVFGPDRDNKIRMLVNRKKEVEAKRNQLMCQT